MRRIMYMGWMLAIPLLGGCHYYQEYRQMKGSADVQEERAELLKAQRECIQKYETNPQEAERRCGMYKDILQSSGTSTYGGK